MGYATPRTDEEAQNPLSPSAAGEEDDLPLYEESQATLLPSTAPLQPPDPKATPDEVRDFLVAVMLARGVGPDHARRVASRWTLGNGRELRSYPVAMYRDIFGLEDGWAVYRDVRVLFYTKERAEGWRWRYGYAIGLVLTLALFIILLAILLATDTGGAAVLVILVDIYSLFGAFAFIALLCWRSSPEKQAEGELSSGWSKAPAGPAR